jgi:hypothetical protein
MALEQFAFQERIKVLEVAGRIAQLSFLFLRRSFFAGPASVAALCERRIILSKEWRRS